MQKFNHYLECYAYDIHFLHLLLPNVCPINLLHIILLRFDISTF